MSKMPAQYRQLANSKQFEQFLDGAGALSKREEVADQFEYDWHGRKLSFEPHFRSQVLLHVTNYRSARDLQWAMTNDPLFRSNGAEVEISVPGFTQANANRPLEPYVVMLEQVMEAVAQLPHRRLRAIDKESWTEITQLLSQVDLFDATHLSLPPSLADWAQTSEDKAGFKVQVRVGAQGAFKRMLLTPASGNDNAYFEDMLDLEAGPGHIDLFDAGYFEIERYHQIYDSGNYFVTKKHGNIKPKIKRQRPLPDGPVADGYVVLEDADVCLGDDETRWYRILRVRLESGKEITLLTNILLLSAAQICLLYRYRWSIEILFRWLKDLLQLDHFISQDPQGIIRQVLVALIVYGLLIIFNQDRSSFSPKQLWRQLQADLHQAIFAEGYRLGLEQGAQMVHLQIT